MKKEDAKGCGFAAHFRIYTVSLDTTDTMTKKGE